MILLTLTLELVKSLNVGKYYTFINQQHPESEKLYCEEINIGGEVRQIASGLQAFVPIEDMSGLVLVLTNLKGRKLAGTYT